MPFCPIDQISGLVRRRRTKDDRKFIQLKDLLKQNLRDLKVFKLGKKEIDIYIVGLDQENIMRGIQTRAVET